MSKKVERFEDLIAWQKARALVKAIYGVTTRRPFAADYALRDQIRSAAISIPSNIAEGFERARRPEFHQFLSIAKGSCGELRTQIYIAHDVGYIGDALFAKLLGAADEVGRIIGGLRSKVGARQVPSVLRTQYSVLRRCSTKT